MRRPSKPVPRTKTYSAVEKLRRRLGTAEAHLKACQTRYDDLRARWKYAAPPDRPGLIRRGDAARLELQDAQDLAAAARRQLQAEERRLLEPDAMLRFI